MKVVSWNVNGLRSVSGKGFGEYVANRKPDVLCLQEIKVLPSQIEPQWPDEYTALWNPAARKGYSGTLTLTRIRPLAVSTGIGDPEGDAEGRVITTEFEEFILVNVYTPNAKGDLSRLDYRTRVWDRKFRAHCQELAGRKPVVFCGDLNVAHEEIDLANPKSNRRNAGFTDEERAEFSAHLGAGFVDTFREFNTEPGNYSWWSYRAGARERNVGWRIDYVCISESLRPKLKGAFIEPEVTGSDHCPVGVELAV